VESSPPSFARREHWQTCCSVQMHVGLVNDLTLRLLCTNTGVQDSPTSSIKFGLYLPIYANINIDFFSFFHFLRRL
jgi:hypothetical protein